MGIEALACEVEVDCAEHRFEKAAIVDVPLPARPQPPFPRPHSVGGQESVKRAVTAAAAGGHDILLTGPGVGLVRGPAFAVVWPTVWPFPTASENRA